MDEKTRKDIGWIRGKLSGIKGISAAYIYGSVMRKDFHKDSDIDVLIIARDRKDPVSWENMIRRSLEDGIRVDVTIIFESEFEEGFHACWSNYYFLTVKRNNKLIMGEDVIRKFDDYKVNFDEAYRRIAWFCQRARGIVINSHYQNDEISFWERKLRRWVPTCVSELLYLNGIFEPARRKSLELFFKFNRSFRHRINIEKADISQLAEFLEELRTMCLKMKKNVQIRNGVAVVLYKKIGKEIKYLLLERQEAMKGWEIIKGGLHNNEDLEQAAIRETVEESGLNSFNFVKVLSHTFSFRRISHNMLQDRVYTLVLIEAIGKKFRVQKKLFRKAMFFSKSEAMKRMIWPEFRESIEVASKSLGYD